MYIKPIYFIALLLGILQPTCIFASTCETPSTTELVNQADHIYIAKVVARKKISNGEDDESVVCGPKIATMFVHQTLKGTDRETVDVFSGDACYFLGNYFNIDEHYLVYANDSEKNDYLEDTEFCTTDTLGYSLYEKKLQKTAKKTKTHLQLSQQELLGTWKSYNSPSDRPFKDITSAMLEFKKSYKFSGKTVNTANKIQKYSGIYYVLGDELGIVDEDGFQIFHYKLVDGELQLTSKDKKNSYTMKKY